MFGGRNTLINGLTGEAGINRATGGGGSGGQHSGNCTGYSGAGAAGTSYSGGSGGGGLSTRDNNRSATSAAPNGGAGGNGSAYQSGSYNKTAGGGAGNKGGSGARYGGNGGSGSAGENGTGGLSVIYANYLYNNGIISANGSNGGAATASWQNSRSWGSAGGSSGGGSINIFAKEIKEHGIITTNGGIAVNSNSRGGPGGNGTVTINELGSVLNYPEKVIQIPLNSGYLVDKNKLTYTKLNEIQTEDLNLGTISYEIEDSSVASIDANGLVTGLRLGKTKVKITDLDNENSTYIIVEVINTVAKAQLKLGNDFTVALKENGTVWTFGKNDKGQLGNGETTNSNKPVPVLEADTKSELENIIDIDASSEQGIAVSTKGEVYTWGLLTRHYTEEQEDPKTNQKVQIDKSIQESKIYATKVDGLQNIIKVSTYNGNFLGINRDGEVFIWGKDYKEITILNTKCPIVEASGEILLGQNGLVYKLDNLNEHIKYVNNIVRISGENDHNIFLTGERKSIHNRQK